MTKKLKTEIQRINGYLKEVTTFFDDTGKPIHHVVNPLMVELKPRDIMQLFVGAFIVAAPLSFTEETWLLSETLAAPNIYALVVVSLFVITTFIYLNFYRYRLRGNLIEFMKRVFATYAITISSVVLILLLIDKFPFQEQPIIAIRRAVIICFPALFGAVLSDYIK